MQYIILPIQEGIDSHRLALGISAELYRLTRPISQPNDVSAFLWGVIVHPVTQQVALQCNFDEVLPIADQADTSLLVRLLSGDNVNTEELEALEALIESRKGGTIQLLEIVPSWTIIQSELWMQEQGWFNEINDNA
jgi:hypothetical protein